MSAIIIQSMSHQAPPVKSLSSYFIRGLLKQREFESLEDILHCYHREAKDKDITKASSTIRYSYEPFELTYSWKGFVTVIKIPAFFMCDGESIGWLQRFNYRGSRTGAFVHDWCYYAHKKLLDMPQEECDDLMYAIQLKRNTPKFVADSVHLGLQKFGRKSYEAYD